MTGPRKRRTQVRLDRLSDKQLQFVREVVFQALYSRAGSLAHLNDHPDPKASLREVAALGRLAESLEGQTVAVPDRAAADAILALARDVDAIHETEMVYEKYKEAVWEHEAMYGLLALFRESSGARSRRDGRGEAR